MKGKVDPEIAAMPGATAVPRKNGEIVFSEPWQSRAFGVAVALQGARRFPWMEFQRRLIDAVEAAPVREGEDPTEGYYRQWLDALERLVVEHGLVSTEELEERRRAIADGTIE